jgi:hypothetical protein
MGQIEVRITPLPPDPNLPFPIRFPVSPSLLGHLLRYSQVPPEFLQGTPPLTASVSTPYFLTSFHTFVSANSCIQTEGGSQTPSVLSTTDRFLSPVLRSFATTLLGAPATTGSCFQLLSAFQILCPCPLRARALSSHLFGLLVLSSVLVLFRKASDILPCAFLGLFLRPGPLFTCD